MVPWQQALRPLGARTSGRSVSNSGCMLGRAEPGHDERAGKRKSGRTAHGNSVFRCIPVRMRQCGSHDKEHPGGKVPQPEGSQVAQEIDHRRRAQNDPVDLSMLSRRQPHIDQGID